VESEHIVIWRRRITNGKTALARSTGEGNTMDG
jgi:hypothetical protein